MRILFLTTVLPSGRFGGGEIWSQNLVDALRGAGAEVAVLGYDRRNVGPGVGEIVAGSRTVETVRNPAAALGWGARALLRSRPYTVQKWTGPDYRAAIRAQLTRARPDLVVVDHAGMAWVREEIGTLPFVHVAHQIESRLYAQHAASGSPLAAVHRREERLLRREETRLARQAAQIWTLGEKDAAFFRELGAVAVKALPAAGRPGWDAAATAARGDGPDLALLGSWTWKPNRAGLVWFLRDVVPLLPPEWRIEVGGKFVPRGLPQHPNVTFRGVVPDAFAFLRQARRIAVPSLSSVGVPVKLLDAIAAGPPVVTTRTALARIGDPPPCIVAADEPEEFARALIDAQGTGANRDWPRERRQALFDAVRGALAGLDLRSDASEHMARSIR